MLGSAFAGTDETPGDVVQKPVVVPESQRSCRCRSRCSAAWRRCRRSSTGSTWKTPTPRDVEALGAEGIEVSVPARGSVRPSCATCSSTSARRSATAARTASSELREAFLADPKRYAIRLTESSTRESFDR